MSAQSSLTVEPLKSHQSDRKPGLPGAANSLLKRLKVAVSSGSFDPTTSEGRSNERYRRAALTTLSSGVAKVIAVSTSLISVPLTLHYLGSERYGLWMTISSLIAFLGFSDLGINLGLLNGIARAHGEEDQALARQYVSSAFFLLTAIALVGGLAFAVAYPWIPWNALFNVKSAQAISEAGPAVATFVGCFLFGIPAGIASRVQSGYQEGFIANLWSIAGSVLSLAALLLVVKLHGPLMLLVLALAGVPSLVLLLNGAVLFTRQRPWLTPQWSQVKRGVSHELLHSSVLFFVLQLAMAIGYSSDNLVLARVMGPDAVTQYAVPAKLFGLIGIIGSFVVNPLWPAYSEALARGDHEWVRNTFRRSMLLVVTLGVGLSAALVVTGPAIIKLWVGSTLRPSFFLLICLGVWGVVLSLSVPSAVLLNAANVVKFQVIVATTAALLNLGLSVYLTMRIGIPGVLLGSIASQVVLVLFPYYFYVRRFLKFEPVTVPHLELASIVS